jgi:hypothetical protein
MVPLHPARILPILVFVFAIVLFGGWIAYDCTLVPEDEPFEPREPCPAVPQKEFPHVPVELLLERVRLGNPRPILERQLDSLPPPQVDPIDVSSGAVVLRSRYVLSLLHPIPRLMAHPLPTDFRPGLYVLVLEYDGSKSGHPLLHAELLPAQLSAQ